MSSALKKAREFRLDAQVTHRIKFMVFSFRFCESLIWCQARYEERRKQRSESDAVKVVPVDITLAPGPSRPSAKSIDFSVQVTGKSGVNCRVPLKAPFLERGQVICEGGARFVSLTMDANSTMDQACGATLTIPCVSL